MYHLYLVRHGESNQNTGANLESRLPDHAIALTPKGEKQAQDAGVFLRSKLGMAWSDEVVLWMSPYLRTRQTAAFITSQLTIDTVKQDEMLVEIQFGIFDAYPKDQLPSLFPNEWKEYQRIRAYNGKYYARRPGGESPLDCEIRQKLWLDSLFRDINAGTCPKHIIVVGHGSAMTILRKAIFHYDHEWFANEPNPGNCSIQEILLDKGNNVDLGYIYGAPEED